MEEPRFLLKGAHNFRDIGGYNTNNGKKIKTGMIFRSGDLSKLRKADIKKIEKLGIKLVIDLRSEQERVNQPSRLSNNSVQSIENISFCNNKIDLKELYRKTLTGKLGTFDYHEYFLSEYRGYVTQHDEELRKIFKLLLNSNNYPVLVHCSGGKDRTGTVTALIHLALGVSEDGVFQDYMLTQKYMKKFIKKLILKIRIFSFFRANIAQLMPLLDTRSVYLQETLNTIIQNNGTVETYLDKLGMHNVSRVQLSKILCC